MQPRHLPPALLLCLAVGTACQLDIKDITGAGLDTALGSVSDPSTGGTTGAATTGETATTDVSATTDVPATTGDNGGPRDVDILFVVDNSGSMATTQQVLASGVGAMVDTLDAAGVDYRIAVTTTDSGNPRCPAATYKPESGKFVISSCLDRTSEGEFAFNMQDFSAACQQNCGHAWWTTEETTTESDPTPKSRPWLERIDGQANVLFPLAEAAACLLPQGVAGCGFEQPLESMYLALTRPENQGFMRTHADLLVVLITDEVDCSYNPDFAEIFTSNKVFWNDPSDPAPTSAVCWRAGATCSGGPGSYAECHADNIDLDGKPAAAADAVLHPVERYTQLLAQIAEDKLLAGSQGTVGVAAIVGVPPGYAFGDPIAYADATNPDYQSDFGIGPGCTTATNPPRSALPPTRIRQFVESLPHPGEGLFSICDGGLKNLPKALGELLTQP